MSRKSGGLYDTLFFYLGDSTFKTKIDLKRSEDPLLMEENGHFNPLQKNRGVLDSMKLSVGKLALEVLCPRIST